MKHSALIDKNHRTYLQFHLQSADIDEVQKKLKKQHPPRITEYAECERLDALNCPGSIRFLQPSFKLFAENQRTEKHHRKIEAVAQHHHQVRRTRAHTGGRQPIETEALAAHVDPS